MNLLLDPVSRQLLRDGQESDLFWSRLEYLSQRGLKALWASASFESVSSPYKSSASQEDPLSEALIYLILQGAGKSPSPLRLRFLPLPVAQLCQIALLWILAGEQKAAELLASSIPLDFPWLWCREGQFDEKETEFSIALLKKAMGQTENDGFAELSKDPFLRKLSCMEGVIKLDREASPSLPWSRLDAKALQCALSFTGNGSSLGVIRSAELEVRAFGPQAFPLDASDRFGIRPVDGGDLGWSSSIAAPEVWFKTTSHPQENRITFELDFLGLKSDVPLAFVFYVKADRAQIGSETVKPRSLRRYSGANLPVCFSRLQSVMKIESFFDGIMEVIPLAGADCFWNCEYLLAFHLSHFSNKFSFSVSLV